MTYPSEIFTDFEMNTEAANGGEWQGEWNMDSHMFHEFNDDNCFASISNSELAAYFTTVGESVPHEEGRLHDHPNNKSLVALEQPLTPRPSGDRKLELVEVHDAMPESFKLPGDTKIYAVKTMENLPNVEGRKKRSDVVKFKCTPAERLKMIFERALKIVGLGQQLEVPTVEALNEMKQCTFSSATEDKTIIGVVKSLHDKVAIFPVEGKIKFSLSQRLSGWSMKQTPRVNGMHDMSFRHRGANREFRSKIEVIKFVLYEIFPPKPAKNKKAEDESLTPKKRKLMPTGAGRGFL